MNDTRDRHLIERIVLGDEEALSELFREHARVLYNHAVHVLQSEGDAEDAVSDLFLSVWAQPSGWPGDHQTVRTALLSRMRDMLIGRLRAWGGGQARHDIDLWSLVSGPVPDRGNASGPAAADDEAIAIARGILGKCGSVSTTVFSLVYFGGYGVSDVADRLSMTTAECRSRLHGCLEMLCGVRPGGIQGRPHAGRFSVCSSAHSVGAITREEEPAYFEHLSAGCPECMMEVSSFSAASHDIPLLLPDVRIPGELLEKILFALRLARIAGADPHTPAPHAAAEPAVSDAGIPETVGQPRHVHAAAISPSQGRAPRWMVVPAIVVIAALGIYAWTLHRELEDQRDFTDMLQEKHTELVLKYDRLAGISGFFESKGVVTVLNGSDAYPGLSGKIVWDTSGRSAMLQILNLPTDLERGTFQVEALRENASVQIAEFRGDDLDTGDVFYRFFPVEVGTPFMVDAFTIDVSEKGENGSGGYQKIMEGNIPGRQ